MSAQGRSQSANWPEARSAEGSPMSVEIRDRRFGDVVGVNPACERWPTASCSPKGRCGIRAGTDCCSATSRATRSDRNGAPRPASRVFRAPSHMANGLAWDRQGRLLCCEHATSRVTRTETDGRVTVLASDYRGPGAEQPERRRREERRQHLLHRPHLWPHAVLRRRARTRSSASAACTASTPTAQRITLLADDFAQPNGLCFSADERRLFVNDTERRHIRVFDVRADGTLQRRARSGRK